jgi:hypothetical protein
MAINLVSVLLIVILVIGIIWFVNNNGPFMRLRPGKVVVEEEPGIEEHEFGCCRVNIPMALPSFGWTTKEQCKLYGQIRNWSSKWCSNIDSKEDCLLENNKSSGWNC